MRASASDFPPLRWLQVRQAETRLSHVCGPPLERGMNVVDGQVAGVLPAVLAGVIVPMKTSRRVNFTRGRGRLIM